MPTKTKTPTRAAGSLAVDRVEYRATGRRTSAGNKPISAVVVDGVELGEVVKAKGPGWIYLGNADTLGVQVKPGPFYLPDTKDDAAAKLVEAALDAAAIRDMDDEAMDHALAASGAVAFPEHHEAPDARDQADARTAAGYLSLRLGVGDGDVVIRPNGRRARVGHLHAAYGPTRYNPEGRRASVQLTNGGSWWLSLDGSLGSYSGGFDGGVDVADLEDTGETALASAQMWHHRTPGAGNAFVALVPVKVWKVRADATSHRDH